MSKIDISKMDKAEVLAALYNNSQPLGLGNLHFTPEPMKTEEAATLLKTWTYFDYLKGRVMKVDVSGDELETALYDRDNGQGAAERVLSEITVKEAKE